MALSSLTILHDFCWFCIRDGSRIDFQQDTWIGDHHLVFYSQRVFGLDLRKIGLVSFRFSFGWSFECLRKNPRGVEESQWNVLIEMMHGVKLFDRPGRLGQSLDRTYCFLVMLASDYLDNDMLPSVGCGTRSNSWIHIKLNILLWRVTLFDIPTREHLSAREILVPLIMCLV